MIEPGSFSNCRYWALQKTLTTLLARAWLGSWPITRAVLQYWHPICLCPEDPKVNRRLTTQYHFISRPFEIFFWRSLIGQWELFFPTILKMTASGRVHSKSHFSAHEWTSGIDFTLGGQQLSLPTVLTYYSVWNSLKHHWCQSTFDLTFPSGTPPWEEAFYSYCIHETATYTF